MLDVHLFAGERTIQRSCSRTDARLWLRLWGVAVDLRFNHSLLAEGFACSWLSIVPIQGWHLWSSRATLNSYTPCLKRQTTIQIWIWATTIRCVIPLYMSGATQGLWWCLLKRILVLITISHHTSLVLLPPLPLTGLSAISCFKCAITILLVSCSPSSPVIRACSSPIFFSFFWIASRAISRPLAMPWLRKSYRLRTSISCASTLEGRCTGSRTLSTSLAMVEGSSGGVEG